MTTVHCVFVAVLACGLAAHAEPRLQWIATGDRACVEVSGLDAAALADLRTVPADRLRPILSARVQQEGNPPMLGQWRVDGTVLRFTPQFPLTPGIAYRAEFHAEKLGGALTARLTADYTPPVPPRGPATIVAQVYPSGEVVPENLLKFYLHFSAPMSRGHIYDHLHLRNEQGKDVELPFLELDEELWDPEMKRLTLFIDPGRIKREVKPLEDIGPALQAGRRFTLVIDADWLDATGHPLARKFERTFRVEPPDRTPITPTEWEIAAPEAGGRSPLIVTFPEPMDHALALRLLQVKDAKGRDIPGVSSLGAGERSWSFVPGQAWAPGSYELIVPAILEDLAGNNVGKTFEVDLLERGERLQTTRPARVPFQVR